MFQSNIPGYVVEFTGNDDEHWTFAAFFLTNHDAREWARINIEEPFVARVEYRFPALNKQVDA